VRPLGEGFARLTAGVRLPWRVRDRAILRDPGSRRLWSLRVVDVDPLPLRRRGAAGRRAAELSSGDAPETTRLRSRSAEHAVVLDRLGIDTPDAAVRVDEWWVDATALETWQHRLS